MKSTTNVNSNKSGCTQVPAGPQRQSYLVAAPAQIQWLQTYLKHSSEFVPESLGICIKTVTFPRLLFPSYHQETSNEHSKDNKLSAVGKLTQKLFHNTQLAPKIWTLLSKLT